MVTWKRGARLLSKRWKKEELPLAEYLPVLEKKSTNRVSGTAVFLTSHPDLVPAALMHNLKHHKVMHRRNIIVCVETSDIPRVQEADRGKATKVSDTFTVVRLKFGFMEEPDVPRALARRYLHLDIDPMQTSYYLSRRVILPSSRSEMPVWQDRLFIFLAHKSSDASAYFAIPSDRAIEIGTQVTV